MTYRESAILELVRAGMTPDEVQALLDRYETSAMVRPGGDPFDARDLATTPERVAAVKAFVIRHIAATERPPRRQSWWRVN